MGRTGRDHHRKLSRRCFNSIPTAKASWSSVRRITGSAAICAESPPFAMHTVRCCSSMKHMERTSIFPDQLPDGAMAQGADMCAQSIHKVTGSMTQSSMLHVNSRLVDISLVESTLHIVQSTSPSYVLMTSLDMARYETCHARQRDDSKRRRARYLRAR